MAWGSPTSLLSCSQPSLKRHVLNVCLGNYGFTLCQQLPGAQTSARSSYPSQAAWRHLTLECMELTGSKGPPLHSSILPWHHRLQGTGSDLLPTVPAPDPGLIEQPELILQSYTLEVEISIPAAPEALCHMSKMNHEKVWGGKRSHQIDREWSPEPGRSQAAMAAHHDSVASAESSRGRAHPKRPNPPSSLLLLQPFWHEEKPGKRSTTSAASQGDGAEAPPPLLSPPGHRVLPHSLRDQIWEIWGHFKRAFTPTPLSDTSQLSK